MTEPPRRKNLCRDALPSGLPPRFRTTVHGTAFAGRDRHLEEILEGGDLVLVPHLEGDQEVTVAFSSAAPLCNGPRHDDHSAACADC